ncbi:hypothetical protein HJFPF1_10163 [Paramyrothecium foliicola]|nr:hypothetical protein HJFPF1_10163 [Paramyrothecium foliicola]
MRRLNPKATGGLVASTARRAGQTSTPLTYTTLRQASTSSTRGHSPTQDANAQMQSQSKSAHEGPTKTKRKTVSQMDEELRSRLEAMSGDGGAAGVEYENGVAAGLRSEVKRNMFRVINMK